MSDQSSKNSPPASKAERQAAWAAHCKKMGWSPAECNRRASIFPPGIKIRVLRWPELS